MNAPTFGGRKQIKARALLLAEHLDLKALIATDNYATLPLTIPAGANGCAVLFRYGAVVLFGLDALEEVSFLGHLKPLLRESYNAPEIEEAELCLDDGARNEAANSGNGTIRLRDFTVERLQVVADVLAKSTALAHYEETIGDAFEAIEPLAAELSRHGKQRRRDKELLRHIGGILLIQHKMTGLVEIGEKPEVLWERSDLDRWYGRLEDEYELRERSAALERKLDVLSRTAETVLNLLQHNSSLRVEWYIVALIIFEIGLIVYDMFGHS
jgi:uncharacterized Rmd1/YagE family protein